MATVHHVGIKASLDALDAIKDAEKLQKAIKKTKEEAANIPVGGGKSLAAAYKGSTSLNELTEYGQTRAMRPGGTGASARDFAQEAQGLGGLVRLYATYAANVYAVSAAFNALSAAQDTANMVKGLNQLGAASGVALGSLSKQLVRVTDGAVSLREAMEATVKASSSGMVSKDILRMGEVAKKASQALGVSMPDALSRISRGITKLEPELLDELGIFTRIDPAVQKYAKSVNKLVASLTQFERQMAFLNAVLEEGENKFKEINIDTNPYTKLAAELKNLLTQIGDTLNTVLAPMVNLLLQSPAGLLMAIGAIASMMVKQALPAIGQFRQSIKAALDATNLRAIEKIENSSNSTRLKNLATLKAADEAYADSKLAALSKQEEAISKLTEQTSKLGKKARIDPAVKQMLEDNKNELNYLDEQLRKLDQLGKGRSRYAQQYRDLATAIRESQAAEVQATKAHTAYRAALDESLKTKSKFTTEGRNQADAQKAAMLLLKQETLLNVANIASVDGIRAAFKKLITDTKDMRSKGDSLSKSFEITDADGTKRVVEQRTGALSKLGAASMFASGAIGILGTALQGLAGVATAALGAVGLVLGIVATIEMFLGSAGKLIEDFKSLLEDTNGALQNLKDNIDRSFKVLGRELFSAKSLEAQATSIINIADSLERVLQKAKTAKQDINNSTYERFVDNFIKKPFGQDVQSKEVLIYAKTVQDIGNVAGKSITDMSKFKTILAETFGITNIQNIAEVEKAISKMDPKKRQEFVKALRDMGVEFGTNASKAKELQDKLEKSTELFKEFSNSFIDKNPFVVYAQNAVKGITDLAESFSKTGIEGNFENIIKLAEQIRAGNPLFGAETSLQIVKYADGLGKIQEGLARIREERAKLTETSNSNNVAENAAKQAFSEEQRKSRLVNASLEDIRNAKNAKFVLTLSNSNDLITLRRAEDLLKASMTQGLENISLALSEGFDRGSEILDRSITATLVKGSTILAQGALGMFKQPSSSLGKMEADLKNRELGVELQMLGIQQDLLIEAKRTLMLLQAADARAAKNELDPKDPKNSEKIKRLDARIEAYVNGAEILAGSRLSTSAKKLANSLTNMRTNPMATLEDKLVAQELSALGQLVAGLQLKANQVSQQMAFNTLQGSIKDIIGTVEKDITTAKNRTTEYNNQIEELQNEILNNPMLTFSNARKIEDLEVLRDEQVLLQRRLEIEKESLSIEQIRRTMKSPEWDAKAQEQQAELGKQTLAYAQEIQATEQRRTKTRQGTDREEKDHLKEVSLLKQQYAFNEEEARRKKLSYELDYEEQILQVRKTSGDLRFNEAKADSLKDELSKRKIILDAESQAANIRNATDEKRAQLQEKINKSRLKAEQDAHKTELANLTGRTESELLAIELIKQARLDMVEAEAEARKNAFADELSNEIANSISTAIFSGGKEAVLALKQFMSRTLLQKISVSINAIINPLTRTLSTVFDKAGGSLAGSFISLIGGLAALSALFLEGGLAAGLTGTVSGMGTALAEGFMQAMPWTLMTDAAALAQMANPGTYAAGNMVGSLVANPLTWLALPVISALMRTTKPVGGGIVGELGGETQDYTLNRKLGWLLGGPEYSTQVHEGLSVWNSMIQNSWKVVTASTLEMAEGLGLATKGLSQFKVTLGTDIIHPDLGTKGIKLDDLQGKNLTPEEYLAEVRSRIEKALVSGSNELAQQILGEWKTTTKVIKEDFTNIRRNDEYSSDFDNNGSTSTTVERTETVTEYVPSEFALAGEKAIETLTRLLTSLTTVNGMWQALGFTLLEASLAGGDAASKIVDSFGGMDKFKAITLLYYDVMYTEAEKSLFATTKLTEAFKKLGYSVPKSTKEFRDLVNSIGTATPEAAKLSSQVMSLAPAWQQSRLSITEIVEYLKLAFKEAYTEAGKAGLSSQAAGQYVADQFIYAIQTRMYELGINAVTDIFSTGIIEPIITAAVNGALALQLILSVQLMGVGAVVQQAQNAANALAELMNSSAWSQLMQQIHGIVSGFVANTPPQRPPVAPPTISSYTLAASGAESGTKLLTEELKELALTANGTIKEMFSNAIEKYKEMKSTVISSIDKLKDFIKSIKEFKTNLLLGDKLTLTPAQKYLKAKTEFETTLAKARTGDSAARERLELVLDLFLTASQDFYASGDQYASDFNTVMAGLDESITSANTERITLEEELKEINVNLGKLGYIDKTLLNIEQILAMDKGTALRDILAWMQKKGVTLATTAELIAAGILKQDGTEGAIMQMLGAVNGVLTTQTLTANTNHGTLTTAFALTAQTGAQMAQAINLLINGTPTAGLYSSGNTGFYTNGVAFASGTANRTDATIRFRKPDGSYGSISQQDAKTFLTSPEMRAMFSDSSRVGEQRHMITMLRNAGFDLAMLLYILTDSGLLGDLANTMHAINAFVTQLDPAGLNIPIRTAADIEADNAAATAAATAAAAARHREQLPGIFAELDRNQVLTYYLRPSDEYMYNMPDRTITPNSDLTLAMRDLFYGQYGITLTELLNYINSNVGDGARITMDQLTGTIYSKGYNIAGWPEFAQGINYVPYDMPAMIHEGERIFPKADNEELMKSIKGNNNAELVNEIRRLNEKVASLERTVAQGAAVNAQATDRNTEAVVLAVSNSTDRTIQSNNIRERATLK